MITENLKSQITAKMQEVFASKSTTQTALALKVDVDKAYINQIAQGKYMIGKTNIKDEYFLKLAKYFDLGEEQEKTMHFDNANGDVVKRAMLLARMQQVILIDSDMSGAGKTYHLKREAKAADVVYVKCTKETNTTQLLTDILLLLGVHQNDMPKGNHNKIKLFRDKMPTNWVLVVDELELVKKKADVYATLKDLADESEGKFGLVLAGLNMIKDLKRKYDANRHIYSQLYSRCRAKVMLHKLREIDLQQICKPHTKKLHGDVVHWILQNIQDYRQLSIYFNLIIEINNEIDKAQERRKELDRLISLYITD
jgi:hypothetical protein